MKYVVLPFLFPANGRIRTSNSGARENISSRLEAIFVNSKNEGYSKGLSQTVQYLRLTRFEVHIPEPARESLFAGQRGFSANSEKRRSFKSSQINFSRIKFWYNNWRFAWQSILKNNPKFSKRRILNNFKTNDKLRITNGFMKVPHIAEIYLLSLDLPTSQLFRLNPGRSKQ